MENKLTQMKCLDVFVSELDSKKYEKVKDKISASDSSVTPLASWDIFYDSYSEKRKDLKVNYDIRIVAEFADKFGWKNNLDHIFESNDFEALVITNSNQEILWVNQGFTHMTGFPKNFALNKKPSFLQGPDTLEESKTSFKEKIKSNKPFTHSIINHKKDQSSYECEVKIFPLYTTKTTHYIALERKIV